MIMESEQGKSPESNALCFATDQNNQQHLSLSTEMIFAQLKVEKIIKLKLKNVKLKKIGGKV